MARARNTDPVTSDLAAESVSDITETQNYILAQLRVFPMADHELISVLRRISDAPKASESGIRSRRAELVERGLVVDSGQRAKTASGRQAIVWRAS